MAGVLLVVLSNCWQLCKFITEGIGGTRRQHRCIDWVGEENRYGLALCHTIAYDRAAGPVWVWLAGCGRGSGWCVDKARNLFATSYWKVRWT